MSCMTKQGWASYSFAVFKRVVLYLGLVLLITAALAVLFRGPLLRGAAQRFGAVETTSFGQNTALIEHKKTFHGLVVERSVEQTRMSRLIERYLGPQGDETRWGLIGGDGPGFVADRAFGPVASCADALAAVVESSMTDDAGRQCLSEFRQCMRDNDNYLLSCDYVEQVIKAVGKLERPAEASDLPKLQEMKERRQREYNGMRYSALQPASPAAVLSSV
jgi:hypothetical protein